MEIKARIPGQVVAIKVNVGDMVEVRTILGTLDSMKMLQDIPCPVAGTVKEIRVQEGKKVKMGEVMFIVE